MPQDKIPQAKTKGRKVPYRACGVVFPQARRRGRGPTHACCFRCMRIQAPFQCRLYESEAKRRRRLFSTRDRSL